ncbi:MAG: exodeoxyribonuclease VII large subunit [Eubacteriales bacterium]|nr:exodeoxyribonuclease VII large subunit [Bacillota bacterium]MBV1727272.1 exodeoxyribonuclease VII large subunit [Desulforudis sp.]MDP3050336.1 exodeoxyribonuclease VII large subunit [Eubacteriales bacterium]MDQ7790235.1 exodeoxyribonuclease VII large subunit [Clostridia bacterium]MBU4554591.1 exodeoxyribonuclease VII large subunit [Bacillota bacterium]
MRIVTVSELNAYIRDILEGNSLLANVWVKGEITNLKYHPSGHLYFGLKDKQGAVKVVMFRSRASKLAFRLENGTVAVVRGYVGVYERDGQYQLYAEDVEPEGLGALYLALEQLKQQLEREGLFDSRRKRALPPVPGRVALVTSAVGAAVKDMLIVLQRRWPMAVVLIVPVAVQGEAAPDQIAAALYEVSRTGAADVVIVGRGGGSPEELWAFNSELVARAIADSRIPVVSAVGHEKDVTIADLVADRRAPTPSAAAELVVPDQSDVKRLLAVFRLRLGRGLDQQLRGYRERLQRLQSRKGLADPQDWLCQRRKDIVDGFERRLVNSMRGAFDRDAARLSTLVGRLEAVSPINTLARGYSICRLAGTEKAVLDAAEVRTGDKMHVQLLRGQLFCTVNEKTETGVGTGGGSS